MALKINQKFIPTKYKDVRPSIKMTPKYITVHNTANSGKGANAKAHANLQYNHNSRQASWHYTVDDKEAWQSLPDNEVGWHAGDGRGAGNMSSIGVEICENSDGNYSKAEANAAELIASLMKKHKISISNVVPHKRWSGKNCPHKILSRWSSFIKMVEAAYKGASAPTTPSASWDGKSFPGTNAFVLGKSHPAVTVLGQRLVAHGYGSFYKVGPGSTFTETDKKATQAFQKAQGWTGSDADGYPGKVTWERLMSTAPSEEKPTPAPKPPTWTKEQLAEIALLNPAPKPAGVKFTRTLKYVEGKQMEGDDVLAVQYFLGIKPFKDDKTGKIVGTFGPMTRDKLKEWQKKNGIKVTGEVGIVNWRKMFGEKKEEPKPAPKPEKPKKDNPELSCPDCKCQCCECSDADKTPYMIRVTTDKLWVYNKLDWDAKYTTVNKGEVFTVVKRYKVGEEYMWKLKSGLYITDNREYTELIYKK